MMPKCLIMHFIYDDVYSICLLLNLYCGRFSLGLLRSFVFLRNELSFLNLKKKAQRESSLFNKKTTIGTLNLFSCLWLDALKSGYQINFEIDFLLIILGWKLFNLKENFTHEFTHKSVDNFPFILYSIPIDPL